MFGHEENQIEFADIWVLKGDLAFVQGQYPVVETHIKKSLKIFKGKKEFKNRQVYSETHYLALRYYSYLGNQEKYRYHFNKCYKYFHKNAKKDGDVILELVEARHKFQMDNRVSEKQQISSDVDVDHHSWQRTTQYTGFKATFSGSPVWLERFALIHLKESASFQYLSKSKTGTQDLSSALIQVYQFKRLFHNNILTPIGWTHFKSDLDRVTNQRTGRYFIYFIYPIPYPEPLYQFMSQRKLSPKLQQKFIKEMAEGIAYLQSLQIVHFRITFSSLFVRSTKRFIFHTMCPFFFISVQLIFNSRRFPQKL